jgi:hypothetical protein
VPEPESWRVPAVTRVLPAWLLAPERVTVPAVFFVMLIAPAPVVVRLAEMVPLARVQPVTELRRNEPF